MLKLNTAFKEKHVFLAVYAVRAGKPGVLVRLDIDQNVLNDGKLAADQSQATSCSSYRDANNEDREGGQEDSRDDRFDAGVSDGQEDQKGAQTEEKKTATMDCMSRNLASLNNESRTISLFRIRFLSPRSRKIASVDMEPPISCLIDTIGAEVEIAFAEKRPILVFVIFNLDFFDGAFEIGDDGVGSLGKLFHVVGIVLFQFF